MPKRDLTSAVIEQAVASLERRARTTAQTRERMASLIRQFGRFVTVAGVADLDDVDAELVHAYLSAATRAGDLPTNSVQHLRRAAVRCLYSEARRLGLANGDPTLDVSLTRSTPAPFRPLTTAEVAKARAAVVDIERAAAWALCEATLQTGELPSVTRDHIDLERQQVQAPGGAYAKARLATLTEWGAAALERRLSQLDDARESPVLGVGGPGSKAAQSTAVQLVSRTLRSARLARQPGVRPSSVAAWAGRQVFDDTGRLDLAAKALGFASLDRTARFIGWDWAGDD